jgi:hypothetical protein
MHYLIQLIQNNSEFAALILKTVDLRQFIIVNFLNNDQAHINTATEFLRCFQTEPSFVKNIYDILIDFVENELPYSIPP